MIYYPLSTLIYAGIQDILIITTRKDQGNFQDLLGDGKNLGLRIQYAIQDKPLGLSQAFILGEEFIGRDPVCLILGDNIFHGTFLNNLEEVNAANKGATIFVYHVKDPERYGVLEYDQQGNPVDIVEKPKYPKSNFAVTGLYFYDNSVVGKAKKLRPSSRGELEITDINKQYIYQKETNIVSLGVGTAWLDTGTYESLLQASQFVEAVENRTGQMIGSIHEAVWRMGRISNFELKTFAQSFSTAYGEYLLRLLEDKSDHSADVS